MLPINEAKWVVIVNVSDMSSIGFNGPTESQMFNVGVWFLLICGEYLFCNRNSILLDFLRLCIMLYLCSYYFLSVYYGCEILYTIFSTTNVRILFVWIYCNRNMFSIFVDFYH